MGMMIDVIFVFVALAALTTAVLLAAFGAGWAAIWLLLAALHAAAIAWIIKALITVMDQQQAFQRKLENIGDPEEL